MKITPFARQLFVAGAPLFAALSVGGAVSFPTVLLFQLKAEDTLIELDFEASSWIGAIHGLAGIPSVLMPTVMQSRGRKFAYITACLAAILGWILAYFATSLTMLFVAESFHGFSSNSIYAVTCLSITEMMAPEYRDMFIQLYYIFLSISMAMTGLMARHVHWKTISLIMCAPMVIAVGIALMWPESPYWLAYKRKYSQCERSFTWLRGEDSISKKELKELINAHKMGTKRKGSGLSLPELWKKMTSRDFYVPCAHILVLEFLVQGIGCIVVLIYSIELFQKATSNSTLAEYGGFIVNSIQLLGIAISILLNKLFMKKTVLLWSITGAIISLLAASLTSYLQETNVMPRDSLLCLYCLMIYMTSVSLGILPVAYPIASALMPVKNRGIGGVLYVTNTCILHTVALKSAPYLFRYAHLWGTFIIFAVIGFVCGVIIWAFIPETKNKTLQEIEDYYTNRKFLEYDDDEKGEHNFELIVDEEL